MKFTPGPDDKHLDKDIANRVRDYQRTQREKEQGE